MFKSEYPVASRSKSQVVRRDQRRQPLWAVEPFQQLKHSPSILLVQISGGFICQQHGRPSDERPGNCDALLFPTREFPCAVISPIFQANLREPLPRHPQRRSEIVAAQQQRHGYVFRSRKIRQQLMTLPEKTNCSVSECRERCVIIRFNRFICEVYCTARWRV